MKFLVKKAGLFLLVRLPISMFEYYMRMVGLIHSYFDRAIKDALALSVDKRVKNFTHKSMGGKLVEMSLYTPNSVCSIRANTFSNKEPETLEWIERFGDSKNILFDIGANIGIYSIYHSLLNGGKTIAFEPSFFNLKQLTKNINANKCEHLISVIANPLSDSNGLSEFLNGDTNEGGSLSAFGVDYGYDGKSIHSACTTDVLGFSLDVFFNLGLLKDKPNLIKIDVDGIEHLILKGAVNTLLSSECKSVLVEVNDDFNEQAAKVRDILLDCGFRLEEKRHAEMFDESPIFNQIWVK